MSVAALGATRRPVTFEQDHLFSASVSIFEIGLLNILNKLYFALPM